MRSALLFAALALGACGDRGIIVAELPPGLTAADADVGQGDGGRTLVDAARVDAPAPVCDTAFAIVCVSFDASPLGDYARDQAMADFHTQLDWDNGLHPGDFRARIAEGAGTGRYLEIVFPKGGVGPDGGAQFFAPLPASYDELYLAFRIRFEPGFDFVQGGILPGLSGGVANTGSFPIPDGKNGWSARMYWRSAAGSALQQVYYPGETSSYGDSFYYGPASTPRQLLPGVWHTVEHRIRMNTVGQQDGIVQAWFDGEPFDFGPIRFRDVTTLGIDHLFFSAFFGGDTPDWASSRDQTVAFDDVIISTHPIAH
jgi:hypothetical protein